MIITHIFNSITDFPVPNWSASEFRGLFDFILLVYGVACTLSPTVSAMGATFISLINTNSPYYNLIVSELGIIFTRGPPIQLT